MKTGIPLDYAPPLTPRKSRLGFAVASIVLASAAGAIAFLFHAGSFDNDKLVFGCDWVLCGLAGFILSFCSVVTGVLGATGRDRKLAIVAIVVSVAALVYFWTSPIPRNVMLP
jgi:hypothetical protein